MMMIDPVSGRDLTITVEQAKVLVDLAISTYCP